MAAGGAADAQARFGHSVKGLLTEKVTSCGTDVIALTKQVLKGSRSAEVSGGRRRTADYRARHAARPGGRRGGVGDGGRSGPARPGPARPRPWAVPSGAAGSSRPPRRLLGAVVRGEAGGASLGAGCGHGWAGGAAPVGSWAAPPGASRSAGEVVGGGRLPFPPHVSPERQAGVVPEALPEPVCSEGWARHRRAPPKPRTVSPGVPEPSALRAGLLSSRHECLGKRRAAACQSGLCVCLLAPGSSC